MITDEQIIKETLSWKGTKWMHGQCVKGYRTDCIQFIIHIGQKFGWVPEEYKPPSYRIDDASMLLREIAKFCDRVDNLRLAEVGDILVFKTTACASHAAIYIGPDRMVEAKVRGGVQEANIKQAQGFHSVWRARDK